MAKMINIKTVTISSLDGGGAVINIEFERVYDDGNVYPSSKAFPLTSTEVMTIKSFIKDKIIEIKQGEGVT